jgi:predicted transcriptional regulator
MLSGKQMAERHIMAMVPATPRFIIRLPADLRAELEKIAKAENRSLTNLIIYALREWLAGRGRRA